MRPKFPVRYLTAPELRRLAGDLTRAARDIEEAQEAFDSFQRFNREHVEVIK